MSEPTRRALVSTVALGTLAMAAGAALPAKADEHSGRVLRGPDKRRLHRDRLRNGAEDFSDNSPLSPDGINIALDRLVGDGIINDNDRGILGTITRYLFDTEIEEVDSLLKRITESITSTLSDVGETIVAVVEDSADYASQALRDADFDIVRIAIAHDMQGAIQGAGAGAAAGAAFGFPVPGAVIGALSGGGSGSVIGFYRRNQCGE